MTASLALLLLAGGAWTATWFYAARTAQTAIAEWIDWEARSGRDYGCGSRTVGGFPFRVEMSCTDPKATVVSEQSTFVVTAKELRATASILKPDVLIVELTGPISGGRPDRSTTFVGNWTLAQATIHGPPASPNQISVVVDGTQFYQATQTSMQPLLTGDRLELDVRLAPASTSRRSVVNIAAHLVGGSIPTGGPITSELFAAEVNAVVHGIGNTTPKALSAYLREWRSGGGRVEIGSARVQQNEGRATAVGSIGLSSNGGVDGSLHVNTAGAYAQLAQSYMRDGQASAAGDGRAAASTLDIRSRSIGNTPRTERELQRETQQAPPGGQSTAPRPQPTGPLEVQIRFVDGAVYIGSAPLGGIPPLF